MGRFFGGFQRDERSSPRRGRRLRLHLREQYHITINTATAARLSKPSRGGDAIDAWAQPARRRVASIVRARYEPTTSRPVHGLVVYLHARPRLQERRCSCWRPSSHSQNTSARRCRVVVPNKRRHSASQSTASSASAAPRAEHTTESPSTPHGRHVLRRPQVLV